MLNGVAPIIIVHLYNKTFLNAAASASNFPIIADVANLIGIPIPIYLDEKLTGIYVESQTRAIDIETKAQPRYDGKPPIVDQNGVNSLVTVNLFARNDSILLTALLALCDMIFQKLVSKEYAISYLNKSTVVLGGLLHGFQTTEGSDDDLTRIILQISKASQESTTPQGAVSVLPKITGATPVPVG